MQGGAAEAFKDEAVGDGVRGAADDGADAGEGFADVTGQREDDGEVGFDFAARRFDQGLQVDVARRDVVELGQVFQHVHAEVALDDDVGAGADGGDTAEHRLARVAFYHRFAAFAAVVVEALREVFVGKADKCVAVARSQRAAFCRHLREFLQQRRNVARLFAFFPDRAAVRLLAAQRLAVGAGGGDEGDAFRQARADAGF